MKYIVLLLLVFAFFSCKKDKQEASTATNINNTSNNNADGPSNATSWYGIFFSSKAEVLSSGTLYGPSYEYKAFFSSSPVTTITPTYSVTVDSVKVNLQPAYLLSSYYYANWGSTIPDTTKWQVYGNNGISSFVFYNTKPMPDYTNNGGLPDSASHTAPFSVPTTAFINYDQASLFVTDNTNTVAQALISGANNITISASQMASLDTSTYGSFIIIFRKNNVQKIGGKDFNFINEFQFTKQIKIY